MGRHASPRRERISVSAYAWICDRCGKKLGESHYGASDTYTKRRIEAKRKHDILRRVTLRLIRRA